MDGVMQATIGRAVPTPAEPAPDIPPWISHSLLGRLERWAPSLLTGTRGTRAVEPPVCSAFRARQTSLGRGRPGALIVGFHRKRRLRGVVVLLVFLDLDNSLPSGDAEVVISRALFLFLLRKHFITEIFFKKKPAM
jgi:hypothetical protein